MLFFLVHLDLDVVRASCGTSAALDRSIQVQDDLRPRVALLVQLRLPACPRDYSSPPETPSPIKKNLGSPCGRRVGRIFLPV
jgi:hypothetical protein